MVSRGTLANLMKFKVLHLGCDNPRHTYRLGREVIESSHAKKDLGMRVGRKLEMSRSV